MVWHYAVWKLHPFMWPACMPTGEFIHKGRPYAHGVTINRGDVNCPDCLRMMGDTQ